MRAIFVASLLLTAITIAAYFLVLRPEAELVLPASSNEYLIVEHQDEQASPSVSAEQRRQFCLEHLDPAYQMPTSAWDYLRAARCDPALYARSRELYLEELASASSAEKRAEIMGLIIATYYGAGEHREGLHFICEADDRMLPRGNSFRYQIHAHLRRISLTQGRTVSARVAKYMSSKCNETDFAEVFAYIPLSVMESVAEGLPLRSFSLPGYEIGNTEDEEGLRAIAARISSGENVAHGGFAFFMLGRFEELIQRMPEFEAAPIAEAYLIEDFLDRTDGAPAEKLARLDAFLAKYPKSAAREMLVRRVMRNVRGDISADQWFANFTRYGLSQDDADDEAGQTYGLGDDEEEQLMEWVYVLESETEDAARAKIADLDFAGASAAINEALERLKLAPDDLGQHSIERLSGLEADIRTNLIDIETLDAESRLTRGLKLRDELRWSAAAQAVFRSVAASSGASKDQKARALYLLGRTALKNQERTEAAFDAFRQLASRYPDHALADDALAEIGWLHMYSGEDDQAINVLNQVIDDYPDANAADNAMWLLASIHSQEGRKAEASLLYARITQLEADSRFKGMVAEAEQRERDAAESALFAPTGRERFDAWRKAGLLEPSGTYDTITAASCDSTAEFEHDPYVTLGRASEGDACEVTMTLYGYDNPLWLGGEDLLECSLWIGRQDGECLLTSGDPLRARALSRAADFDGRQLFADTQRVYSKVTDKEEWKSRILVGPWTDQKRSAPKSGPQIGWAIVNLCGVELRESIDLGRVDDARRCTAVFLAPGAPTTDERGRYKLVSPLHLVECKATVTSTAVDIVGHCRALTTK